MEEMVVDIAYMCVHYVLIDQQIPTAILCMEYPRFSLIAFICEELWILNQTAACLHLYV